MFDPEQQSAQKWTKVFQKVAEKTSNAISNCKQDKGRQKCFLSDIAQKGGKAPAQILDLFYHVPKIGKSLPKPLYHYMFLVIFVIIIIKITIIIIIATTIIIISIFFCHMCKTLFLTEKWHKLPEVGEGRGGCNFGNARKNTFF